jgi:hypothetical protein
MYPAAAVIRGGEFIGARGHTRNELSTWTSTRPRSLRLRPDGRSFVHVTIRVPSDAASGERYGVVWAQVTTPPSEPGGLRQVSRVGIRLYLSIGPGGAPASDFDIVSITAARDGHSLPMVQASIHNTGGRALDLSGTLSLSDGPGGLSAGPFPLTLGTTVGIGQTERAIVSLDRQIPDGPWRSTLTVHSGLTKRTARATLTFPPGPGVGAAISTTARTTIPPWLVVIGIAAALLLLILLTAFFRRALAKRRNHEDPHPV